MPGFVTGVCRASGYAKKVHAIANTAMKRYGIGTKLKASEKSEKIKTLNAKILEWFEKHNVAQYDVVNILAPLEGDEENVEIPEDKVMVIVYEPKFIILGGEVIEGTPEELDQRYKEYLAEIIPPKNESNSKTRSSIQKAKSQPSHKEKNSKEKALTEFLNSH